MPIFILMYKRYVLGAYTTETAARMRMKSRAQEKGYDLSDLRVVEINLEG